MKRLYKLEQRLGRYGEQLLQPGKQLAASDAPQNQWIVNEIRTILDERMSEHSSKPELTQHFSELFSGLETITAPAARPDSHALAPEHTEAEIVRRFDVAYYHGRASFEFATKVLADARVKNVEHFVRAVAQGGTILRSWTGAQRELFQLHAANKLWRLGRRDAARAKLRADYTAFWGERLRAADPALAGSTLRLLARALVVTRAVDAGAVLSQVVPNWRSLYAVWTQAVAARAPAAHELELDVEDAHLWQALRHLAASHRATLPAELDIVPASVPDAPRQIRSVLLRRAQTERDTALLDLLLASSSRGDKIVEAGALAAKLALT